MRRMGNEEACRAATAPLSHCQSRVWFLQRIDPSGAAYHEAALWHIDGPLDIGALRAALVAVAARQPMLRTRFPTVDGVPCQAVDDVPRAFLECVDLPASGDEAGGRLEAAARECARRPFALAEAPPIRWTLCSLGRERHALVLVWHHILGDGLSERVLLDDLARAYAAARTGAPVVLPALPLDYLTYSVRQERELAGPEAAKRLDDCRARLAGAPALALPADFRRPATQSFRGGVVSGRLDGEAVAALRSAGREAGATSFASFLTAYAVLLSRLSGDADLVIGMTVAARPLPELAEVFGFFANTVACRVDFSGAPSTSEALRRTYAATRAAMDAQQVPFERLVDALGVPRDASRNPLFQVAFGVRRRGLGDLVLAGCTARRRELDFGRAHFDLTLTLIDGDDGLEHRWEYCSDLFERATVERMARQYATLVAAMAREPGRPVASLPLMDDATRSRIVASSAGPATVAPCDATIAGRFQAQAAATPSAPAIGALDYAAMDAAANRLAAELRVRGVASGAFVAVARGAAADIAIAWIAVLKAGGAYLPIDPELPAERLAYVLEDAKVAHAIADEAMAARLARPGIDVVRPEREAERIAAHAALPPPATSRPRDPAYAIYTSGSSGRPKGVVVPHEAVVRLVCGTDYVELGPDDVVAQLANPAFDASTFEFWGALLNGARLAPIPKATAIAPRALGATIAQERITTLFVTTALFDAVAREVPAVFAPCRTVLFGGEAAAPRRVADVLRAGAPRRLLHVYGPTETTTFATWQEVRTVPENATTVPIGRAIANAEVYVLREDGEPAAPGEPGEICIAGAGLALRYLGAPEGGAPRFVEARIGDLPARRLYRTGDRARLSDEGAIEFLGRADGQVKVRGHRIELAEVEDAIARQPGVRAAAAVLRGDTSDTRRIVAFVVPANPSAPPPEGLRRDLRRLLPAWMLPAEIAWLPALPLNANGKVDRKSLPSVDGSWVANTGLRVPPRDRLESELVRHWEAMLGRTDIGVFDHFFDLGGHSLLAARMADDYERRTGIRVPLTALFVDDTVAGLARAIREESLSAGAEIVPLHEGGSRPPFVYVHGDFFAGGFHCHALAKALGPDQPFYVVHPHGVADGFVPTTIEAMAADRLRTLRALRPHGPYVVGGHCNGAFVAFELASLLLAEGESVPAVIVVDGPAPGATSDGADDDARAAATLAARGIGAPTKRVHDLAHRLHRAMRGYRGRLTDVHLVIVRSAEGSVSSGDAEWERLASSAERHVLPGDHITLVVDEGGEQFAALIRGVIDRAIAGGSH